MARNSVLALVLVVPLLVSGCGSSAVPRPITVTDNGLRPVQEALPGRVRVECSPRGIALSTSEVAAQASGVVLVVSSTMPPGTYLTYRSDGAGSFAGGDPLPRHPSTWALPLAPGTITLGCGVGGENDPRHTATVRVTDPSGFWRGDSLANAGCNLDGGQPSWVIGLGASGTSAVDAVQQTLHAFEALARSQHRSVTYTARPAEIGYVGADTQTWIAAEDGRAHLTIDVTRTHQRYAASPNDLCHD